MTAKDFIMAQLTRKPEVRTYDPKAPPKPEDDCFGKYPDPAAEECGGCLLHNDCQNVLSHNLLKTARKAGVKLEGQTMAARLLDFA